MYQSAPAQPASAWTGPPLAEWPQRVLATLIDAGVIIAAEIVIFILAAILGAISSALGLLVSLVGYLVIAGYGLFLGYQTGVAQTLGKRVIGIQVVKVETLQPIGGGMGIVRAIAHFADSLICYIGWLFPLWDAKKQTLADKIMGTVAIRVPQQKFDVKYLTATS